jgi:hypothetical protein
MAFLAAANPVSRCRLPAHLVDLKRFAAVNNAAPNRDKCVRRNGASSLIFGVVTRKLNVIANIAIAKGLQGLTVVRPSPHFNAVPGGRQSRGKRSCRCGHQSQRPQRSIFAPRVRVEWKTRDFWGEAQASREYFQCDEIVWLRSCSRQSMADQDCARAISVNHLSIT